MKNWESKKQTIIEIIKLVEDPDYPARRSILDYVEELFGYPADLSDFIEAETQKILVAREEKEKD